MNLILKRAFVGLFVCLLSGCAISSDRLTSIDPVLLCEQASVGELNIGSIPRVDPRTNAYLLGCAVSVVIPQLSFQSGAHKGNKTRKNNKIMIADYFLSQKLDMTYQNEDGNNVLMSVVTSFLSDSWKEKAVNILLSKGVNLKAKNHNGDTALDIAKFKGNERIIKLVSF